jgi:predicted RNA-binding Zn-ribbon protein involved in translation (DUF1610 family)
MSHEIACSACHRILRVEKAPTSPWLTCPRCLARVVNPAALVRTDFPSAPARSEPASPGEVAGAPTCLGCGREVRGSWRVCPECGEPLRRPALLPRDDLDRAAHRDNNGSRAVAIVLGVLVVLGIILFFALGGVDLVNASKEGPGVLGIGVLALGAIVVGVLAIAYNSKNPTATAVSGIVGGVTFGVGAVLLVVLLSCLAALAAFQNFIETCGKGCR